MFQGLASVFQSREAVGADCPAARRTGGSLPKTYQPSTGAVKVSGAGTNAAPGSTFPSHSGLDVQFPLMVTSPCRE